MIFVLVPYTSSVKIALCMRDEIGVWVEGLVGNQGLRLYSIGDLEG